MLVVYGVIIPTSFTQFLTLAGRHSVRFEEPISATWTLKETIYTVCFLFSVTSAGLLMRPLRSRMAESLLPLFAVSRVVLTVISIFIFVSVVHFGMRHFSPYDQSATLDLGWRLSLGQRPYGQFFNQFPPGHYLPLKFAFEILGASWRSMVLLTAVASVGSFVWMYMLLCRITRRFDLSLIAAFASVATTGILFSFWWYNPMTTLSGCIFLLSAIVLSEECSDRTAAASYFFALAILSMMKPNLAAPLILLVTVVLAFTGARNSMVVLSLSAFVAVNLFLFVNGATLPEVVRSYLSVHRTGSFFIQDFVPFGAWGITVPNVVGDSLFILFPVLTAAVAVRWSRRAGLPRQTPLVALCVAGISSGFLALATNMELFISDGTLMILASVVILLRVNREDVPSVRSRGWEGLVIAICAGLVIYGTSLGAMRLRQWIAGPPFTFHEVTPSRQSHRYTFFAGMTTGKNFERTMDAMQAAVKTFPGRRIYFDNTYSFAAAVFNLRPLTIDVKARAATTPRVWPMLLPAISLMPSDAVDVLVCSYPCEEASKKLALILDDSLTLRSTRPPFLSDVFVYTRPGLPRQ